MVTIENVLKSSDLIGLKKLLKDQPNLMNDEDDQGATILAQAIKERCSTDIINFLIEQGADIREIDNEGINILEYAITYANHDLIPYLLEQGVQPHTTQRKSGFTPLMAAVCYNHVDLVKLFIEKGVDLFAQDNSGLSAMDFARRMHRKKILAILEAYAKDR